MRWSVSAEARAGLAQLALLAPATLAVLVLTAVVQLGVLWIERGEPIDPASGTDQLVELITPISLYASAWAQNLGLFGACALVALVVWLGRRALGGEAGPISATWIETFALRPTSGAMLGIAVFGGLSLMWLPAAVMEVVLRAVDLDNLSTELVTRALRGSGPVLVAVGVLTIGVVVPLFEELVFRGFLWRAGERWMPPALLLTLTSAVFAMFHLSPAHVLGVVLHAVFLGWLRLTSGSIAPPVVAHVANNSLACALILAAPDEGATSAPVLVAMALYGAVAVPLAAWGAWRYRTRTG